MLISVLNSRAYCGDCLLRKKVVIQRVNMLPTCPHNLLTRKQPNIHVPWILLIAHELNKNIFRLSEGKIGLQVGRYLDAK